MTRVMTDILCDCVTLFCFLGWIWARQACEERGLSEEDTDSPSTAVQQHISSRHVYISPPKSQITPSPALVSENKTADNETWENQTRPLSVLQTSVRSQTQILVALRNNRKLLGRVKAFDRHANMVSFDGAELRVQCVCVTSVTDGLFHCKGIGERQRDVVRFGLALQPGRRSRWLICLSLLHVRTEAPKGKGRKPVNKDRFVSKMCECLCSRRSPLLTTTKADSARLRLVQSCEEIPLC